jgi:glycosyltransferase involved in cell wall biosynthesis
LDADVVVGNCELPELYLALTSLRKFEAYCVEHTSSPWFGRRILGYCVRTVLAMKNVSWVTVSREASPIWPSNTIPRFIPNPVKSPNDNDLPISATRLAYVGRLRTEKRPDWALAVSEISGLGIDFYGDGPMETELKARADISEIDATFHGYTENVWDSIHSNTIIIAPSQFEGDGLAIVEAILRGLPIALADNADLRRFELSDDCYSSSPSEMAKKLLGYSESNFNDLRPSQQMIDNYRQNRSLESISEAWEQFLRLV